MPTFSRGFVRPSWKALPRPTDRRPIAAALAALAGALAATAAGQPEPAAVPAPPSVRFVNVAGAAGLTLPNVSGEIQKTSINETVGNGICLYDVDDDGRIDLFIPNGSRGRPFPPGQEPRSALYRN